MSNPWGMLIVPCRVYPTATTAVSIYIDRCPYIQTASDRLNVERRSIYECMFPYKLDGPKKQFKVLELGIYADWGEGMRNGRTLATCRLRR